MEGMDKQTLDIAGRPLSLRVVEKLRRKFPEITVVSRLPESYGGSVRVVQDILPGFGPLSGLHAALSAAEGEWIYLAACDMPNFSGEWAQYLIDKVLASEDGGRFPLACAASCGKHLEPFHALYSRGLLPIIERLLEGKGASGRGASLSGLLRAVPLLSIPEDEARVFSPDWSMFFNINTQSDWKEYLDKRSETSSDQRDIEEEEDSRRCNTA